MEVIHKFIDTDNPMSIMALPEAFMNRKPEIITLPTDEQTSADEKRDVPSIV